MTNIPYFRIWHKIKQIMLDVRVIDFNNRVIDAPHPDIEIPFEDVILMQETHTIDKTGTPIYEGDILEYQYPYDRHYKALGYVIWKSDDDMFAVKDIKNFTTEEIPLNGVATQNALTVIGNIYENLELLNQKEN